MQECQLFHSSLLVFTKRLFCDIIKPARENGRVFGRIRGTSQLGQPPRVP